MENVSVKVDERSNASVERAGAGGDLVALVGEFMVECYGPDGERKWADRARNSVTKLGRNWMLDYIGVTTAATGVAFVGMITSNNWSATDTDDTMNTHAGWEEAGVTAPAWSTPASGARQTTAWSAASASCVKALSSASSFTITGAGGTLKGCFIVLGSGAAATNGSTAGVLLSAGTFSGGDKAVSAADVVNVSYSLTLTATGD